MLECFDHRDKCDFTIKEFVQNTKHSMDKMMKEQLTIKIEIVRDKIRKEKENKVHSTKQRKIKEI